MPHLPAARSLLAASIFLCILLWLFKLKLDDHAAVARIAKSPSNLLPCLTKPIVWQLDHLQETQRDPLNRLRTIEYGPFDGAVPREVSVNEPFKVHFTCLDNSLCPESFAALIVGPAQHAFTSSANASQVQKQHTFQIAEPGIYKVYLWPHFGTICAKYYDTPDPWYERLATGSPFALHVTGGHPVRVTSSACRNTDDILDGRWVNTADLHMSELAQLGLDPYETYIRQDRAQLAPYIWLPYTCHVQHRSMYSHLARLKAKHILVLGDSVMRDPFCQLIYEPHVENVTGSPCDASIGHDYHWLTKQVTIRYGDSPEDETLLSFVMATNDFGADGKAPLKDEEARITPTHIIWNQGLWFQLARASAEVEYETMTRTSRLLLSLYPDARHIIRGTTSMHENIACYEHLTGRDASLRESDTARRVYEEERIRSSHARLAFMETFKYSDARPDSSKDGRHYSRVSFAGIAEDTVYAQRPRIGELDMWFVDLMFEIWAQDV
ncbi:hypothetical protein BCR37DRAFT_1810 [Protomyces lactucae-debilis]|uniref:Uncharacterized protein n=1 Tax=Protomyces lactucae-debilis TaxID=2754530 RepID=A0A1Y2FUD4_PROLT|nr:uncharacterized protein BCR37DRAFT_1810 [Protomyces lactucae-debilis]ORY87598.1 hypothetical protein BCR37DRAFT_1810 [Protomyces lactucae-debilis]